MYIVQCKTLLQKDKQQQQRPLAMLNLIFVDAYISVITCLTLHRRSLGKYSDVESTKMQNSSSVTKSNDNIFSMKTN